MSLRWHDVNKRFVVNELYSTYSGIANEAIDFHGDGNGLAKALIQTGIQLMLVVHTESSWGTTVAGSANQLR